MLHGLRELQGGPADPEFARELELWCSAILRAEGGIPLPGHRTPPEWVDDLAEPASQR